MYTDTHFHFSYFSQNGEDFGTGILETMAKDSAFLGLDVGTKCDDLLSRRDFISDCIEAISDSNTKHKCERMIRFSAGIWPDVESIKNRESCMETLREQIEEFKEEGDVFSNHLVAIGEAGLDHHWNPSGADGRSEDDFDTAVYEGISELLTKTKNNMTAVAEKFKQDLGTLRTGRANPQMIENVRVEYYGVPTPLKQMAMLNVSDARTLEIQPWDATAIKEIEKALQQADLGVTPMNDGKLIRITFPPMTEDRRKMLTKTIAKMSEDYKVSVRSVVFKIVMLYDAVSYFV